MITGYRAVITKELPRAKLHAAGKRRALAQTDRRERRAHRRPAALRRHIEAVPLLLADIRVPARI